MSAALTIRDVPDDVRETLLRDAKQRGQSLQAFLLSVLERQARFSRNRQLLEEIDEDLARGGGAGPDAPESSELIDQAWTEKSAPTGKGALPGPGGVA